MEPAELVPDDEEHPEGLLWVLGVGEEVGREAEGQSDFGGLVEVCLQYGPIFFGVIDLREGEKGEFRY